MKDKFYLIIIGGLLIVGIVGFIFLKRANNDLVNEQTKQAKELKEQLKQEKDSLIVEYSNEIEAFRFENNSLNEINENLNIKIRNYEKKLSYSDRTFDTAVDVLSNAKYDSKSKE